MAALEIASSNNIYWLASRSVRSNSYFSFFDIRDVSGSGDLYYYFLCRVDEGGISNCVEKSFGFRPVFTLKSEIKVTNGDGDVTPYTLAP